MTGFSRRNKMKHTFKLSFEAILILSFGLMLAFVFAAPADAQCKSSCSGWSSKAAANSDSNTCGGKSIVDLAVRAGSFDTLVAAVQAAGLVDTLKGEGPFTVFAPVDEAFARISDKELNRLLKPENKDELKSILTYHVVPGSVPASAVVNLDSARTVNGQSVAIRVDKNGVFVDNAKVIKTDIMASNGVIHVIDRVIVPKKTNDIVDVAAAAGSFNTLVSAVQTADLVETLKGEGPYTVFAPSDEAFARLPKDTLRDLLKPENKDALQAILTYHIVPSKFDANKVVRSHSARTVNGNSLGFRVKEGRVFVDDALVVKADIQADNGIIHVIDSVLLPE
jgi:transforming growth factor-beta-induced protein